MNNVPTGERNMARMQGVEPHEAGWSTRLIYWFVKRALYKITGRSGVPEPIKITAYHSKLLRAVGQMERGQAATTSVPAGLKALAGIRAATLVGCPF
jgi:hypothetical protein